MQVKGRTFKLTFDFILHKFGKSKLASFLEDNPSMKDIETYNDLDWYNIEKFASLTEAVDKYLGFGDGSLSKELGSFSSQHAFETSHKLFKGLTPESMVSSAQTIVSSYYSEVTVSSKYLKDKKLEIKFEGLVDSMFLKKRIMGWLKQTMILAGAKNLHISGSRKGSEFTYVIEWSI